MSVTFEAIWGGGGLLDKYLANLHTNHMEVGYYRQQESCAIAKISVGLLFGLAL